MTFAKDAERLAKRDRSEYAVREDSRRYYHWRLRSGIWIALATALLIYAVGLGTWAWWRWM